MALWSPRRPSRHNLRSSKMGFGTASSDLDFEARVSLVRGIHVESVLDLQGRQNGRAGGEKMLEARSFGKMPSLHMSAQAACGSLIATLGFLNPRFGISRPSKRNMTMNPGKKVTGLFPKSRRLVIPRKTMQ